MTSYVIGIDTGALTTAAAEHSLQGLEEVLGLAGRPDAVVCTHFVRDERPHVALSVTMSEPNLERLQHAGFGIATSSLRTGPAQLAGGAEAARNEAVTRSDGRAVVFPGAIEVIGEIAIRDVLLASAIEEVRVVGGAVPRPEDILVSDGYVRPVWTDGRLVLLASARADGTLAPFEVRDKGTCCGGH